MQALRQRGKAEMNEWIKMKDKKPNLYQNVLMWDGERSFVSWLDESDNENNRESALHHCIYWMAIPNLPKEDKKI